MFSGSPLRRYASNIPPAYPDPTDRLRPRCCQPVPREAPMAEFRLRIATEDATAYCRPGIQVRRRCVGATYTSPKSCEEAPPRRP